MSCSFVPGTELNDEEDMDLPFIFLHHYQNIFYCSFHNKLIPEHGKTCPLCMNIYFLIKEMFQHKKFLY